MLIRYDLSQGLEIWEYLQVLCEGSPAEVHKQALDLMGQVEWVTWDEVTGAVFVWGKGWVDIIVSIGWLPCDKFKIFG